MLWDRLSCKSQRPEPNRCEPVAICAACARLHNGIIDYLFTSHNNSAVYLIIGAFQSPTPTRSSPISSALFEPSPPASDNQFVAWADEAGQRLSILCGVRAALPRRIREREFSVRERRGDGDFPVKLLITSAWRSDLEKAALWTGRRRGNPAALQGMSESQNKIGRSSQEAKRRLWRCGGECGWAREEIIGTPARRGGRHISHPNSPGRPWSIYQNPPPAALTLRSESRAGGGGLLGQMWSPTPWIRFQPGEVPDLSTR